MKNQDKFVEERLIKYGLISRNYCLDRYITRLGAIINRMVGKGYTFEGKGKLQGQWIKTKNGKDFIYYVKSIPRKK